MKICLKCNRNLFDNDTKCDICNCTDIMDKFEYEKLYNKFKNASSKEQKVLRQSKEYEKICKYKFIIDKKNTPEKRRQQSIKDKQLAEQKSQQEYEALRRRAQQKRIEKEHLDKETHIPKCPTCGSTNIRRISTVEKATGTILFGIFSNKRKCQFECQNPKCKYKW